MFRTTPGKGPTLEDELTGHGATAGARSKKAPNSADKLLKKHRKSVAKPPDAPTTQTHNEAPTSSAPRASALARQSNTTQILDEDDSGLIDDSPVSVNAMKNAHRKAQLERSRYSTLNFRKSMNAFSQKIVDGKQTLKGTLTSASIFGAPTTTNNNPNNSSFLGVGGTMTSGRIMELLYEQLRQKEEDLSTAAELGLKLTEQYHALQEDYAAVLQELEETQKTQETLRNAVVSLGGQVQDESRVAVLISERLTELATENDVLTDQIAEMREELLKSRERDLDHDRRLHNEMREKSRAQETVQTLENRIQQLEQIIEEYARKNRLSTRISTESIDSLSGYFGHGSLRNLRGDSGGELGGVAKQKGSGEKLEKANQTIEQLTLEVEELKERLVHAEVGRKDSEDRARSLQNQVDRLKNTAQDLKVALQDTRHEHHTSSTTTANQLTHALAEQASLSSQLSQLTSHHHATLAVCSQVLALTAATAHSRAQAQAQSGREERDAARRERDGLLAEGERMRENLGVLEAEIAEARATQEELLGELQHMADLQQSLQNSEQQNKKYREEINAMHDNLSAIENELILLREEATNTQRQLAVSEERLQIMRLAKESLEHDLDSVLNDKNGRNAQILSTELSILTSENKALESAISVATSRAQSAENLCKTVECVAGQLISLLMISPLLRVPMLAGETDDEEDDVGITVVVPRPPTPTAPPTPELSDEAKFGHVEAFEREAFSQFINKCVANSPGVGSRLPLEFPVSNADISRACADGVVLCKLVNVAKEDFLDERVLNTKPPPNEASLTPSQITENVRLCLNSCRGIGCQLPPTEISVEKLASGHTQSVLRVVAELAKVKYLDKLNLKQCRELIQLTQNGESAEDLTKLAHQDLLLRWVSHHVTASKGKNTVVTEFGKNMKDCEVYVRVLHQLFPNSFDLSILSAPDFKARASKMLDELAKKFPAHPQFLTLEAIEQENQTLSLLFFASLFGLRHGLRRLTTVEAVAAPEVSAVQLEGDREARVFALWMNSMGVQPPVYNVFENLRDGVVLLQLFDAINPGTVDWHLAHTKRPMLKFNKIQNNNYALKLGRACRFSLVGIDGSNIEQGHRTFTLALVWQMMRLHIDHTLHSLGHGVTDTDMVVWANRMVSSAGKSSTMSSFKDPNLRDSLFILDLEDSIRPGIVDYSLVKDAVTAEDFHANAKYAISVARKLGAMIFLAPEDIVEVKHKMVLTFVGALMACAIAQHID